MPAVLILGMHRSGTSCLAGMFAACGIRPPGPVVRNWDNAHGHFEATAAVRLNEAVLAHSGGHWLAPPQVVRWNEAQAAQRDQLLRNESALLKDPRTLLTLPFWLASTVPMQVIGIVRHPLAVARSLLAWRGIPLDQGLTLWTAHNRNLLGLRQERGISLLDFDQPMEGFLRQAATAMRDLLDQPIVADALRPHYDQGQVHHDGIDVADRSIASSLEIAFDLHRELVGETSMVARDFPWSALRHCQSALAIDAVDDALRAARHALSAANDPVAVLVPIASEFLKRRRSAELLTLLPALTTVPPELRGLIAGKAHLDRNDAVAAVAALRLATAGPAVHYEARHLLPIALRRAGQRAEAVLAQRQLLADALHPHQVWATLAEWAVEDKSVDEALLCFREAIALAPTHRRGRLRSRVADLQDARGERQAAIDEAQTAISEDPGWERARVQLAKWI